MTGRVMQGVVVSAAGEKTVVVRVERRVKHPLYKKYIRRANKFHAHDELNRHKVGDRIRIREAKPKSKLKRWEVVSDEA